MYHISSLQKHFEAVLESSTQGELPISKNFHMHYYALAVFLDQLWDLNQSQGNVLQQELLTIQLDLANKHVIKVNFSQNLPCFVVNVD